METSVRNENIPKPESAVGNGQTSAPQKSLKSLPSVGFSNSQEHKENGDNKVVESSSKNNHPVVTRVKSEIRNIFELDQCPVCGEEFDAKTRTKLRIGNHFDNHFATEIQASNGFSSDEVTLCPTLFSYEIS
jgi:hypothetical protein